MHEGPAAFRFGSFEFNLLSGELRKSGVRLSLESQPGRLLAALLARPGEVINREELRAALWPEDTYVEFDRSLTRAINKVRTALGDSAANPRFIETLPRRGYRFVAPVSIVRGPEGPAVPADSAERDLSERGHPPRFGSRGRWWTVAVVVTAVAAASGWLAVSRSKTNRNVGEAEEAYARGLRLSRQRTLPEARAAAEQFRHAIELRPDFAPAYAGLAEIGSMINPSAEAANVELAERAVRLDPKCGECHGVLGFLQFTKQWRWREAETHLKLALLYAPGDVQIQYWDAQLFAILGRPKEALERIDNYLARSPQSLKLHVLKAACLYFLRDYDAAVRTADGALAFNLVPAWDWRSRASFLLGNQREGVQGLIHSLFAWASRPEDAAARSAEMLALLDAQGLRGPLERLLDQTSASPSVDVHAYSRASWQMLLGRADAALSELELGLSGKSFDMVYVAVDPLFAPLHGKARFREILKRMGLPQLTPSKPEQITNERSAPGLLQPE